MIASAPQSIRLSKLGEALTSCRPLLATALAAQLACNLVMPFESGLYPLTTSYLYSAISALPLLAPLAFPRMRRHFSCSVFSQKRTGQFALLSFIEVVFLFASPLFLKIASAILWAPVLTLLEIENAYYSNTANGHKSLSWLAVPLLSLIPPEIRGCALNGLAIAAVALPSFCKPSAIDEAKADIRDPNQRILVCFLLFFAIGLAPALSTFSSTPRSETNSISGSSFLLLFLLTTVLGGFIARKAIKSSRLITTSLAGAIVLLLGACGGYWLFDSALFLAVIPIIHLATTNLAEGTTSPYTKSLKLVNASTLLYLLPALIIAFSLPMTAGLSSATVKESNDQALVLLAIVVSVTFITVLYFLRDTTQNKNSDLSFSVLVGCPPPASSNVPNLAEPVERALGSHALSERELQIVCLIYSGSSMSEIADSLGIKKATIATYAKRVYAKLNIRGHVELIALLDSMLSPQANVDFASKSNTSTGRQAQMAPRALAAADALGRLFLSFFLLEIIHALFACAQQYRPQTTSPLPDFFISTLLGCAPLCIALASSVRLEKAQTGTRPLAALVNGAVSGFSLLYSCVLFSQDGKGALPHGLQIGLLCISLAGCCRNLFASFEPRGEAAVGTRNKFAILAAIPLFALIPPSQETALTGLACGTICLLIQISLNASKKTAHTSAENAYSIIPPPRCCAPVFIAGCSLHALLSAILLAALQDGMVNEVSDICATLLFVPMALQSQRLTESLGRNITSFAVPMFLCAGIGYSISCLVLSQASNTFTLCLVLPASLCLLLGLHSIQICAKIIETRKTLALSVDSLFLYESLLALGLTRREAQVAIDSSRGLSSRSVAKKMVISANTVRTHLHRAYSKLSVHNRQDLALAIMNVYRENVDRPDAERPVHFANGIREVQ